MLYSLKRSLQCRQVGAILMNCSVDGTAGTPVASGLDEKFIESVVDNGAGDYTITVKEAAKQNLIPAGIVSLTDGAILSVSAVTPSSISVIAVDDTGASVDADFIISWIFMEQLSYNF